MTVPLDMVAYGNVELPPPYKTDPLHLQCSQRYPTGTVRTSFL
jgi:hypothetical protein